MKTKKLWQYSSGRDVIFSAVIILLMVAIFIYGTTFEMTSASGNVDSGFFPRLGSALGFVLGVVLLVQSISKYRKEKADAENCSEIEEGAETDAKTNWGRMLFSLLWLAVYLLLMQFLGMPIASIIYLLVQTYVLTPKEKKTKKNILINVAVSVLMPLVVYFPFRYVFDVMLPMGIFR